MSPQVINLAWTGQPPGSGTVTGCQRLVARPPPAREGDEEGTVRSSGLHHLRVNDNLYPRSTAAVVTLSGSA